MVLRMLFSAIELLMLASAAYLGRFATAFSY
jgi:hypothetical protein